MSRVAPVAPTRTATEIHSPELATRTLESLVSNGADPLDRDDEVIVASPEVFNDGYASELAFMEEPVTIILHRRREKFAPAMYDFSVQGRPIWIHVDRETTIPRKYLEVIARSQPYDVTTEVKKNEDQGDNAVVQNIVHRHPSAGHPFTVIKDPNPRGPAWLAKVMRES